MKKFLVDGIDFYASRTITVGTAESSTVGQRFERGKDVDEKTFKHAYACLESLSWSFGDMPKAIQEYDIRDINLWRNTEDSSVLHITQLNA